MSRKRVIYNPYRKIDFSDFGRFKADMHIHIRGFNSEPDAIIDSLTGEENQNLEEDDFDDNGTIEKAPTKLDGIERKSEEYNYFGLATNNPEDEDVYWAEGDDYNDGENPEAQGYQYFSQDNSVSYSENRDPVEHNFIQFPSSEWKDVEHVVGFFCKADDTDISQNSRKQVVEDLIDIDRDKVVIDGEEGEKDEPPLVTIAHPSRYDDGTDIDRWDEFDDYSIHDGLIGIEVVNKGFTRSIQGGSASGGIEREDDRRIADNIVEKFAPERPIWFTGVNDCASGVTGYDFDLTFTKLFIDESKFNPEDQLQSRRQAYETFKKGCFISCRRLPWLGETKDEWESDEAWLMPKITNIELSRNEIKIEGEDYTEIRWVCGHDNVVDTGEVCDLTKDEIEDYIRAFIVGTRENVNGEDIEEAVELWVNPFMIEELDSFKKLETETSSEGGKIAHKIKDKAYVGETIVSI